MRYRTLINRQPGLTLPSLEDLTAYPMNPGETWPAGVKVSFGKPSGTGNILYAPDELSRGNQISINLPPNASNNTVVLGHGSDVSSQLKFFGNDGIIVIGSGIKQHSQLSVTMYHNSQTVMWGQGATSNGASIYVFSPGRQVIVGDGCMFAAGITVRTADHHGIFELETGRLLNPSANVLIEPYVWICQDALILKGALIGFGSIIGARSVVGGVVERQCIAAGQPAKIIRRGVGWSRRETPDPRLKDQLEKVLLELLPFDEQRLLHQGSRERPKS